MSKAMFQYINPAFDILFPNNLKSQPVIITDRLTNLSIFISISK